MSDVHDFGAMGNGVTDDRDAILHALEDGDGSLQFGPGIYKINQTIEIPLEKFGPLGINGSSGTAKILMTGKGPAFRIIGTHDGTGDPTTMKPNVWTSQRLPTIQNIEIEGQHPEADGIELIGTMQAILEGVLIHKVRHGIHLTKRNRNVIISHCQIYHNTGVGIYLNHLNLHQINIASNHISYNRLGGIRIEKSEIRNLQITGNDIEYNNHRVHDTKPEPTAEIYIDTTAENASVNEVTIASNTIQATDSPNGCNIRIQQKRNESRPPGLISISGNIIGSQEINVHFTGCHGITVSGNCIYSSTQQNLLVEDSDQIVVTGNSFRRHSPDRMTGIRFVNSHDCILSGCTIRDEDPDGQQFAASLVEISHCDRMTITGCQILDGVPYGIDVEHSSHVSITCSTIMETRAKKLSTASIRFREAGKGNLLSCNTIGKGTAPDAIQANEEADLKISENVIEE